MLDIGVVNVMGARARELLSRPDFSGQVLAMVSNGVYLNGTGEEVLWLAPENSSRHGRAILGAFDLRVLQVGGPFRCEGPNLRFGRELALDFSGARVWQPLPIERAVQWEFARARVQQLLVALESFDCGESLGVTMPLVAALVNGDTPRSFTWPNPFIAAAFSFIEEIVDAYRTRDTARLVEAAHRLVGLGPGLTPSGDDFLGGLLFAEHYLCAAYPEAWPPEVGLAGEVLDYARAQTNLISYTLLHDHARGQGTEPLHALMAGLLGGQELDALVMNARRLIEIGNTSGWDMLAGVMTALLCWSSGFMTRYSPY